MIRKKGKDLEFISFIKRDGSGTIPIGTEWDEARDYPKLDDVSHMDDDRFTLKCLSISENTYIAHGFNSFVVKIKPKQKPNVEI